MGDSVGTALRLRFARRFQRFEALGLDAVFRYVMEVAEGVFPDETQCCSMEEDELTKLTSWSKRPPGLRA